MTTVNRALTTNEISSKKEAYNVVYEWAIEQLEEDSEGNFEVKDHRDDCAKNLPNLITSPLADNEQLCLVREVFDKEGRIKDRDEVVVTSNGLPECFCNKVVIPQRFHAEVAKYPLSIHASVARLE